MQSANRVRVDVQGWDVATQPGGRKEGGVLLAAIREVTSIVKKSACIILNICTTHNGDYAPFRQRHFDLLPWNITPAAEPGPTIVPAGSGVRAAVWGERNSPRGLCDSAATASGMCVQPDEPGRWADGGSRDPKLALF